MSTFDHAWADALAALELDVDHAERMLAKLHGGAPADDVPAGPGAWAPPTHLGPLPDGMLERAKIVLARQLAVTERIAHAAVRSRKQLDVDARMHQAPAPARPMFVDAAF
ncbi:hypothetical protein [Angustibacter aerolatus]